MATKLVEKGNSVVEVNVSLDSAKWHENQDKALKKLCENVTLKGFRKGKVPFELAKDHVSKGDTLNEAINLSLNELYQLALSENKLQPYAQPEVRVEKVNDDELEVKFIITLMPTCKLGAYKGLNIKEDEKKILWYKDLQLTDCGRMSKIFKLSVQIRFCFIWIQDFYPIFPESMRILRRGFLLPNQRYWKIIQ